VCIHPAPPPPPTPLSGSARQVTAEDFERFDLVVAMDRDNLRYLERLGGPRRDRVRLLGSFLAPEREGVEDVPDPYWGGGRGFDIVLDMMEAAAPRILDHALGEAPRH
jgi:protein-tyrosine phosphatase